jgi:O-antigen/teichoic acid export membrane protein
MYFSYVIGLVRSRLAKHLTLLFLGNMLAAGIGFVTMLIIARSLTVAEYGLFNVAVSALTLAAQLSSLGTHTATTTFASRHAGEGDHKAAGEVFRVSLYVVTVSGALIAAVFFLSSGFIAESVFGDGRLSLMLKFSAVGALIGTIAYYLRTVFNALARYRESVGQQVVIDVVKLAAVAFFVWLVGSNAAFAVAAFAFAPAAGVVYGFKKLSKNIFIGPRASGRTLKRLVDYSKWTFASNVLILLSPHVGIFMLTRMMGSEAAGVYGLALNLTYVFPILVYSLHSVLMPEVSRFNSTEQFDKYLRSTLKIAAVVGGVVVPVMLVSGAVIPWVFGPQYAESVRVFNWLLVAFALSSVSTAIRVIMYAVERPYVLTAVDAARLTLVIAGCYIFIPYAGVVAPAVLAAVTNVIAIAFLVHVSFKIIRRRAA